MLIIAHVIAYYGVEIVRSDAFVHVKVPWSTRLGDVGQKEIGSRLSYFSTANKYDRDIGIDFYCELLKDDSPLMPFYVQAKGTEHFDNDWRANIKKSTVVYWLQQPSPVFLVVYDEKTGNCYWMSIEDNRYSLIEKIFKTSSDTISLKMDRSHVLQRGKDENFHFIRKIKQDRSSVELFRGRPLFRGDGYVKRIPALPRSRNELRLIRENIRAGLYCLLCHNLFRRGNLEKAYLLGEFLTKFDKRHYNHFAWFGLINKARGDKEEAKKHFEMALELIEKDKNWPRESVKAIIEGIKKEIQSCR